MSKPKIHVILASTRPNRAGKAVMDWLKSELDKDSAAEYSYTDLAELNLPFLDEPLSASSGQYEHQHTKDWSKTIDAADGFIWLTAEYNNGYPAPLKNAIDFLYKEWNRKPVAFVSYGNIAGGTRAVQQLKQVASELQMAAIRPAVTIPTIWEAVKDNRLDPTKVRGEVSTMTEDLLWWANALRTARGAEA